MDDVRKAAQERAARANNAPVGTSFETERQRTKKALVKQITSQNGQNVRMIAASSEPTQEDRVLRVAAYCRVSTDDIDQALSIHLQIQQYMPSSIRGFSAMSSGSSQTRQIHPRNDAPSSDCRQEDFLYLEGVSW